MKKDIKDASYGLEQVLKLRAVTFHWKDETLGKDTQFGLIAQEVQNVFPELVRQGPDGNLALNYVQLVPVLTKAVQEQQRLLERQQSEIAAMRSHRSALLNYALPGAFALGFVPMGFWAGRRRREEQHSRENAS